MVGLDLSAAFDTINHQILLERLKSDFGIDGLAFSWIQSYLSNRTQYAKLGNRSSSPVELLAGVPQGSVLGPLLFTIYTSPLSNIIHGFEVFSPTSPATACLMNSEICGSAQMESMIGILSTFFN